MDALVSKLSTLRFPDVSGAFYIGLTDFIVESEGSSARANSSFGVGGDFHISHPTGVGGQTAQESEKLRKTPHYRGSIATVPCSNVVSLTYSVIQICNNFKATLHTNSI